MGSTFALIFFGVFALAIGQAFVRRMANPYREVALGEVPGGVRDELERVLPGYAHRNARLTRKGDEVRLEGSYLGQDVRIEAELTSGGELIEFEVDGARPVRKLGLADRSDLSDVVAKEIERVLGASIDSLEGFVLTRGRSGSEPYYELDGRDEAWKWEVSVTESGQLLEMEREKRRR